MVMSKRWNLNNYGEGCSHIVVNDVKPTGFGPSGESYWREVLGCQESFDATDRYRRGYNGGYLVFGHVIGIRILDSMRIFVSTWRMWGWWWLKFVGRCLGEVDI